MASKKKQKTETAASATAAADDAAPLFQCFDHRGTPPALVKAAGNRCPVAKCDYQRLVDQSRSAKS